MASCASMQLWVRGDPRLEASLSSSYPNTLPSPWCVPVGTQDCNVAHSLLILVTHRNPAGCPAPSRGLLSEYSYIEMGCLTSLVCCPQGTSMSFRGRLPRGSHAHKFTHTCMTAHTLMHVHTASAKDGRQQILYPGSLTLSSIFSNGLR